MPQKTTPCPILFFTVIGMLYTDPTANKPNWIILLGKCRLIKLKGCFSSNTRNRRYSTNCSTAHSVCNFYRGFNTPFRMCFSGLNHATTNLFEFAGRIRVPKAKRERSLLELAFGEVECIPHPRTIRASIGLEHDAGIRNVVADDLHGFFLPHQHAYNPVLRVPVQNRSTNEQYRHANATVHHPVSSFSPPSANTHMIGTRLLPTRSSRVKTGAKYAEGTTHGINRYHAHPEMSGLRTSRLSQRL